MAGVYELLTQIVTNCLSQPTFQANKNAIQDNLRQAVHQTRNYLVYESSDLNAAWGFVRGDTATLDFLMEVTTQLHLMLANSPMPFSTLATNFASAMGAHRPARDEKVMKHSVVDTNLIQRMPDANQITEVLKTNSWFVTLMLLSHRPTLLNE